MAEVYGFIKKIISKSKYTNYCKFLFKEYNTDNSFIMAGNLEHCFIGISYIFYDVYQEDEIYYFNNAKLVSVPDAKDFKNITKLFLS